jgi:hypothetical protein
LAKGFINIDTVRQSMTETTIPNSVKTMLNNPYYLFNDKTASIATYYNLNTTMTTLDEATRENYAELTANSPLRFNKVTGFYLYGISKIEPNLEITEYGLEGSAVDGEAVILPNTVVPYPGDVFTLDQLGEKYIFQVTHVNPNTLDTGSVMYKVNYVLYGSDGLQSIEDKVVKSYKFIYTNVGTNYACLIEDATYLELSEIEIISKMLKDYYIQLFYDVRVQTMCYYRDTAGFKVHDPYLLEFLIRNEILSGSTDYIYLDHQLYLPNTFGVDYDRTIFSTIDHNDLSRHIGTFTGNLLLVTQKLSLLYAYPQDYYYMEYVRTNNKLFIIDIFDDPDFGNKIKNNTKTGNVMKDIIIGFFNKESIKPKQLEELKHIDYMNNAELYYLIPFTIYILDKYIQDTLSKISTTSE